MTKFLKKRNHLLITIAGFCGLGLIALKIFDFQTHGLDTADLVFYALWFLTILILSLILSYEDVEKKAISNRWILLGIALYFCLKLFPHLVLKNPFLFILEEVGQPVLYSLLCVVPLLLITLLLEKIFGHTILGGGDFKYLFMVGLFSNLLCNILTILFGFILAAFVLFLQRIRKKKTGMIPMIPLFFAGYVAAYVVIEFFLWRYAVNF